MIANLENGLKGYMNTILNSGTTCLAAKELNRKFIGIEKEVKYYDLAVARVFGQHCHYGSVLVVSSGLKAPMFN